MRDRTSQLVLGAFVGIFAYALVVLRAIRSDPDERLLPSLTVTVGLALALLGVAVLVYFIHHIITLIQASHILARIADDTRDSMARLYPEPLVGDEGDDDAAEQRECTCAAAWLYVAAPHNGYITQVDLDRLFEVACAQKSLVRMERGVGEFVVSGCPLAAIRADRIEDEVRDHLLSAFGVSKQRTTEQDPAFGIRQIVDVGLKALSPGVNDVTTAVMAVDHLASVLFHLGSRSLGARCLREHDEPRVLVRAASYGDLLDLAFAQLRQNGGSQVNLYSRLIDAYALLSDGVGCGARRRKLLEHLDLLQKSVRHFVPLEDDQHPLLARLRELEVALAKRLQFRGAVVS